MTYYNSIYTGKEIDTAITATRSHLENKVALLGDSLTAMCWTWTTLTTLTQSGGTATATKAEHGFIAGQTILVTGADQTEYNGEKTILTVPNVNTFTFTVDSGATSPATTATVIEARNHYNYPPFSWFTYAAVQMQGNLVLTHNAGIGGYTTAQMLADINNVIINDVDIVIVWGGHNDLYWDDTSYTVPLANLQSICNQLVAAGKHVVLLGAKPECAVATTAASRREIIKLNHALIDYVKDTPGIDYVDIYPLLIDPTDTDGKAVDGYHLPDNIHLSGAGAQIVGQAIADVLNKKLYYPEIAPTCTFGITNQLLSNPLMQGTGGDKLYVSGDVPNSCVVARYTGEGTYTASVEARTVLVDGDAMGNNLVVTCADATLGEYCFIQCQDVFTSVSTSDKVFAIFHIQINNMDKLAAGKIGFFVSVGGVATFATALDWWPDSLGTQTSINGFFRTPEFTIPTGLTSIVPAINFIPAGTGEFTIKMGRAGVYKV